MGRFPYGTPATVPGLAPLARRNRADQLDVYEVSAYTGYAVETLRTWRSTTHRAYGQGPAWQPTLVRVGRGYRGYYLAGDVADWLKARAARKAQALARRKRKRASTSG